MSITDELREYASELDAAASRKSEHGFSPVAMKLAAIADRIDEQHRKALEKVSAMVDAPPKLDELDRAVAILEQHDTEDALRISELFVRVEQMERKLNHKGGAE